MSWSRGTNFYENLLSKNNILVKKKSILPSLQSKIMNLQKSAEIKDSHRESAEICFQIVDFFLLCWYVKDHDVYNYN